MTSVRIIVTGEVQGVGFRNFVMRTAQLNEVWGWARNVGMDMIEILLQGENAGVENVISQCYMGPDNAVIETVHVEVE
jgi:acylphosphatase